MYYFTFLKEAEDLHWKVSRTRMWMNWVNKGSVLPPPYNLIPNPKAVVHFVKRMRDVCRGFNPVGCNLHTRLIRKGQGRKWLEWRGEVGGGAGRWGKGTLRQGKERNSPSHYLYFSLAVFSPSLLIRPGLVH